MYNKWFKDIIVGLMIFSLLLAINLGGRRRLQIHTEAQKGIISQQLYFFKNSKIRLFLKVKFQKSAHKKIFAPSKNKFFCFHEM